MTQIPHEDFREHHRLERFPTVRPRHEHRPLRIWYWIFTALEQITCLIGLGIVATFFIVALWVFVSAWGLLFTLLFVLFFIANLK
jgi:hypothetical protein